MVEGIYGSQVSVESNKDRCLITIQEDSGESDAFLSEKSIIELVQELMDQLEFMRSQNENS